MHNQPIPCAQGLNWLSKCVNLKNNTDLLESKENMENFKDSIKIMTIRNIGKVNRFTYGTTWIN